ncbi:hypothetical protein WBJ53_23140 [Spirosoma sp. SC4-14]|uniref:hypothetical protein n=1 Tax=Spirosoma sp. SC4-14 TaxID=3128900 RepID=UPI0030CFF78E
MNGLAKITLCLLSILASSAVAQVRSVRGGAGFLYLGPAQWPGAGMAVQQLNPWATSTSNDHYLLMGSELYWQHKQWLFGLGASALVNKRVNQLPAGTSIESSASNGHIWIGRIVWQGQRAKLYPSLAPGISAFNVNSTTAGSKHTTHTLDGFSADIGLSFDWLLLGNKTDKTLLAGPMLKIQAGYRFMTASSEWHGDLNDPASITTNRYAPRGFYLTLGIGGGGFRIR